MADQFINPLSFIDIEVVTVLACCASHLLCALVEELKLSEGIGSRAMPDVQHTVNLFLRLWDKQRLSQQLHLLSDCLPLVGALLAAEENNGDENGLLIEAACRVLQRHQGNGKGDA